MTDTPTTADTSPLVNLTNTAPKAAAAAAAPPAKTQPSAAAWADMSPDDRAGFQRREIDAANNTYRPPDRKPGEKVDAETYEKMTFSERVAYAASFQDKPAANPDGSPADPAAPPVADPNAERIKVGEAEFTKDEILAALSDKATRDANLLSVPAKPSDYKLDLPADLKLPEGVSFKFDAKDPIKGPALESAREWAKANELTQEQFSSLLGLYAGSQAHEAKLIFDGATAEKQKMGPAGTARVIAVTNFLKAELGDDLARPFLQTLVLEKMVTGWEKLIQKRTSQGVPGFRSTGREAPEANGRLPSGPEGEKIWNSWSYHQQKEYSDKFTPRR
jgi:hypothetical protein